MFNELQQSLNMYDSVFGCFGKVSCKGPIFSKSELHFNVGLLFARGVVEILWLISWSEIVMSQSGQIFSWWIFYLNSSIFPDKLSEWPNGVGSDFAFQTTWIEFEICLFAIESDICVVEKMNLIADIYQNDLVICRVMSLGTTFLVQT